MPLSDLLIFFFLFVVGLLLLYYGFQFFLNYSVKKPHKKKQPVGNAKSPCPLCGTMLYGGENIISRVYKTGSANEQPCTIHGCPHCFPDVESGLQRLCPVCHKKVPTKGHLTAYIFTRNQQKKHVHVTGCTECHKKK